MWRCTGDLFILVYGVDSRESFDEVKRLLAEIYEAKGQHSGIGTPPIRAGVGAGVDAAASPGASDHPALRRPLGKHSPPVVIVGNKCDRDLHRVVSVVSDIGRICAEKGR